MHSWRRPLTQVAHERDLTSPRTQAEVSRSADGGLRVSARCGIEQRPNQMWGSL